MTVTSAQPNPRFLLKIVVCWKNSGSKSPTAASSTTGQTASPHRAVPSTATTIWKSSPITASPFSEAIPPTGKAAPIYIAKKTGDAFKDITKSTRSSSSGEGGNYPEELVNPPPPNKLYLTARNNGTIAIYDDIDGDLGKDGAPGYKLIFGGDNTGSSNISGKIHNADIYSGETVNGSNHIANIANAGVLSDMNNNLTVNSGDFNIRNLDFDNLKLNKLTLSAGNLNVNNVKVDLVNNTMGTISANDTSRETPSSTSSHSRPPLTQST